MLGRSALAVACIAGGSWLWCGCGGDGFVSSSPAAAGDAGLDAVVPEGGSGDVAQQDVSTDQVADAVPDQEAGAPDAPLEAGPLANGKPCTQGTECLSGVCAGSVCCNVACEGCSACDLTGHEGTCTPVQAGQNPGSICGTDGDPCAGSCDGAGACAYPSSTTTCGASSCSNALDSTIHKQCDGAGKCTDVTVACGDYLCSTDTGECQTSCTPGASECASGAWCNGQAQCVGKSANGQNCGGNGECISNYCVDGVCCDTDCSGTCEACNLTGTGGTCTPIPAGTDPAGECVGTDTACAGACDGQGACAWPGNTTQCGSPVCAAGTTQNHQYFCDSHGSCQDTVKACDPFVCDPTASSCKTSCVGDGDCIAGDYCKTTQCVPKMVDGERCGSANQCQSGYCELSNDGATCCSTACPAPMDCSSGDCVCSGVTCAAGHACVLWYPDVDQDGFGDGSKPKSGCDNLPPTDVNGHSFVLDHTDCYDKNPDAHPGQTHYFFTDRGDGSFDYDCNGVYDKQYRDGLGYIMVCSDCKVPSTCDPCGTNNTNFYTYGFGCNSSPTCGPSFSQAFQGSRPCGTKGKLFACNSVFLTCSSTIGSTDQVEERCR